MADREGLPEGLSIWDLLPCEGHGVTADRIYRPRALMSREQAEAMLAIAAKYPPKTIREEFLKEAREVLYAR